MKIYFAGAIRGGREKVYDYQEIINCLEAYGEVLTKHIGNLDLTKAGENLTDGEIYNRDIAWLDAASLVLADVTIPSLGVGYELAYAEGHGKKVICCYEEDANISGLIKGNNNFIQIPYIDIPDLIVKINEIMEELEV